MSGSTGVPTDASLRSVVHQHLDEFEELTKNLIKEFAAVAQPGSQTSEEANPERIVQQLIALDAKIQSAAEALRRHQLQQQRLARLQQVIDQHDRVVFNVALELQKAQNLLSNVLNDAKDKIAVMDAAEKRMLTAPLQARFKAVDPTEVVDYAASISYTVAPPPNWRDGVFLGPYRSGYPAWASDVVSSTWFRSHYGLGDQGPEPAPDAGVSATAESQKGTESSATAATAQPEKPAAVQIVEFDEFDSD